MRRVVVTGLGAVTPLGYTVSDLWSNVISSKSGIKKIECLDASNLQTKIAGEIVWSDHGGLFDPTKFMDEKEIKRMAKFSVYAMYASALAVSEAGIDHLSEFERKKIGVAIGSGIGGLEKMEDAVRTILDGGKLGPFFIPSVLSNMAAGNIAIKYGFNGPNISPVTACATGNHAIGEGFKMIAHDITDIVIAGGAESTICALGIKGFNGLKALATNYNDDPTAASRPWDKKREGFVMGEGAGILILEEYEHAKKRGAKIYGEVVGYGASCDAHHMTAPDPDGEGAELSIRLAMESGGVNIDDIDYVNAHGTSTQLGDVAEIVAMRSVFGDKIQNLAISSTKSSIGHLLGAAGAVEAVLAMKVLETGIIPPTLNLEDPDDACVGLNLVPLIPQEKTCDVVLSNSFGFGSKSWYF